MDAISASTTIGEVVTAVEKETGEHFSPERILKMCLTRANAKSKGKERRARVKQVLTKLQEKYGKEFDLDEVLGALGEE